MRKLISSLAVALTLAVGFIGGSAYQSHVTRDHLPACATEDSEGCYWDADKRGNGKGHDIVSVASKRDVCAVQRRTANRAQCERYRTAHQLRPMKRSVAREVTNGQTSVCRVRYGDTSYVFCLNGRRYVS